MLCRTAVIAVASLALLPICASADDQRISDTWVMTAVRKHGAMYHSENPSHMMLLGQPPPKGVVLESTDYVRHCAPASRRWPSRVQ
jgi:hypothetical protein